MKIIAGLGSIPIVAEKLGLKWVAIDKNTEYAEISRLIIKESVEPRTALKEKSRDQFENLVLSPHCFDTRTFHFPRALIKDEAFEKMYHANEPYF